MLICTEKRLKIFFLIHDQIIDILLFYGNIFPNRLKAAILGIIVNVWKIYHSKYTVIDCKYFIKCTFQYI